MVQVWQDFPPNVEQENRTLQQFGEKSPFSWRVKTLFYRIDFQLVMKIALHNLYALKAWSKILENRLRKFST